MYIEGSPQNIYHCETYGHPSKFGYKDTIPNGKQSSLTPPISSAYTRKRAQNIL